MKRARKLLSMVLVLSLVASFGMSAAVSESYATDLRIWIICVRVAAGGLKG